jgi:hypothetical protein
MAACAYARAHVATVQSCLDGRNLHSYLGVLGLHLFVAVFRHVQKFTYTFEGSFSLQRDLGAYHSLGGLMGAPRVEAMFGALRLVGAVMGIESANVVHVLSSSDLVPALSTLLSLVHPRGIADLVACREDARGKAGKAVREGVERLCEGIAGSP